MNRKINQKKNYKSNKKNEKDNEKNTEGKSQPIHNEPILDHGAHVSESNSPRLPQSVSDRYKRAVLRRLLFLLVLMTVLSIIVIVEQLLTIINSIEIREDFLSRPDDPPSSVWSAAQFEILEYIVALFALFFYRTMNTNKKPKFQVSVNRAEDVRKSLRVV